MNKAFITRRFSFKKKSNSGGKVCNAKEKANKGTGTLMVNVHKLCKTTMSNLGDDKRELKYWIIMTKGK